MERPVNGFEFIDLLRKQDQKKAQSYARMLGYLSDKARDQGVPFGGQFELTPLCNFDCRMCYVHLNPEQIQDHPILSVDTWKNIIRQAWESGMCTANLTGGECLTYPGFEELYLYLHSLGCSVGVLTNGYLLDEQRIDFFKKHKPCRIQITLYGWNDDVYERVTGRRVFRTVYKNIQRAVEAELPVSLSITPNTFLGEDVLETVKAAKGLCKSVLISSGLFSPREETGRSGQQAQADDKLYLKIYRPMYELHGLEVNEIDEERLPPYGGPNHACSERGLKCSGGRSSFVIDWKGTMMPCNRLSIIRADVLEEGFVAAWEKINRQVENWPRVPECKGCPYHDVCANCAGSVFQLGKTGQQPIQICEQTKFFVKHGVKHIADCE